MMKRKLYLVILLFASVFGFTSCNDYFKVDPTGSVSEDDYDWQVNNLRLTLNSVYNLMQSSDYGKSELIFGECMSDNAYNAQDNDGSELCQLLNFQFDNKNSYILTRYSENYKGINLANQVISAVPQLNYNKNYSTANDEVRYVLGQAKLLRALFYFNLVKTFGGVPIQNESTVLSNVVKPRVSADSVYHYIEKDLREACLLLYKGRYKGSYTSGSPGTGAGQAGIGAGLGLLMKVLAYEASPGITLENPQRAEKWKECKEIGDLFIGGKDMTYDEMLKFSDRYKDETWDELVTRLAMTDQSPTLTTTLSGTTIANIHGLVTDFGDVFRLNNEFNKESLLEINHANYSNSGSSIDETNAVYICTTQNQDEDVGCAPTKALISLRDADPRGLYTVASETTSNYFKDSKGNTVTLTWFNIGDGWVFDKWMVYPEEGNVIDRNYLVMRYAEALLWYSEALNETGNQSDAITILNRVRARAAYLITSACANSTYNKCTSCPLYSVLPYQEVKKDIAYERRIELACEFDRWWDIVRTGDVAAQMAWMVTNQTVDKNSGATRWRGKYFKKGINEIFPIPQDEITISNGTITQNPGY